MITLGLTQPERRSTPSPLNNPSIPLSSPSVWSVLGSDGRGTESGELISWESSLQISTVYSCVRILAESIANLPIRIYSVSPQGRMIDTAHPVSYLLSHQANPDMSSVDWVETTVAHLAVTGNAFSQIERLPNGTPIALWPLNPRKTDPVRLPDGSLAYKTSDGETGGKTRIIQGKAMLHPRLTSWDGILGMSPVTMARRALGLDQAAEKFGSRLFANSAVPSPSAMTA